MTESAILIPNNGIQPQNGIQQDFNPMRRKKRLNLRLRIDRRVRRMIRVVLIVLLTLIIFLLMAEPVAASAAARHQGARGRPLISIGRYSRYERVNRVPEQLPELPVRPLEQSGSVVPFTYAQVVQDDAAIYGHPSDAVQGLPPKRTLGVGYVWVSVQGKTTYDGQDYYQINAGEYVQAEALKFYQPSAFQGVAPSEQPERPFAWILTPVQPSFTPAGEANVEAPIYQRYQLVEILAAEHISDQVWYEIGPDQWINQITVGKVTPSAPPEGVAPGEKWIDVDLFEQTLAAYDGDRMVYATLVSSGLPGWDTPTGLSRVWLRVAAGKMSGGEGRPDYYFLEDVPWTMYFNKDVALHTAYWHDGFGYKHSHGCVNLPPLDAQWLFQWAPEDVWVWVHAS